MANEELNPVDQEQKTESAADQAAETAAETETVAEAADAVEGIDAGIAPEMAEMVQLASDLSAAQAEIESLKDQMLRIQADAQNVRRRAEADVEKAHKYGVEKFANEMLPILDSLERAIEAFGDDEALKPMREGVEMTMNMFISGLAKFQMEQVNPKGEMFDPALHQAMSMIPVPDTAANTVVEVMQKGYTLHGRLVRPAMVIVAKG
ncbi:nucleotide exchange factor GrpE [Neptuniibacter sp.]|uniref:nucleotide exchange factor GrpE n=1 Tax=Neptuniibacter sp. TaxID=1962643 RepID=UPI002603D851|nr:nucleotide exchange factor GrpE [Neptuniibacter sp.]MCP4598752.1 nucleotide exchange factor GrpE [Neptuniibacter sp.]